MKKKLLLFLSRADYAANVAAASTFAWLAASREHFFDLYYDSHHLGVHFQGGDWRVLESGKLTGGTVCGGRHFQEFYFLLQNFDVVVVATGKSLFLQSLSNFNIPVLSCSEQVNLLYRTAFEHFGAKVPEEIVMIGANFEPRLAGLDAFLYPEIYYRRALGVSETISDSELADLCGGKCRILCFYVGESRLQQLQKLGYELEIVDRLAETDSYASVTQRIALRWKDRARGWIVGDPTLIAHWIPTACEENLVSIYSIPQRKILLDLESLLSSTAKVVYGRQYDDSDFFHLSKMNQALQVIDPCRPPFQTVRHAVYRWDARNTGESPCADEYTDEELKEFAAEGRVLVSLIFWTGMIREVENFHALMDLVSMTGLKCGMAVTAQTYEYMMHAPFELLSVPLAQGGVHPLVEPLLGSCGIGVGIEESFAPDRLAEDLLEAMARVRKKLGREDYVPRGWWPTMDAKMKSRHWFESPKRVRLMKYSPYIQIRFHLKDDHGSGKQADGAFSASAQRVVNGLKAAIRESRFMKHFEPYRPYEFYKPDSSVNRDIIEAVKAAGLRYMFTKAAFNSKPAIQYVDEKFIALNYTAGQWDGWTPFETVNDVSDLRKAERRWRKGKPGWITSTIDSCLWTFSGEFWKRGSKLFEIASFCAQGGHSGKLINAKPVTVSRYARIIAKNQANL